MLVSQFGLGGMGYEALNMLGIIQVSTLDFSFHYEQFQLP